MMINMKYNLPDRILRELSFFAKKYSVTKIILFGSRARGTNTERSDIDIAVYGGDFDAPCRTAGSTRTRGRTQPL